MENNNYNIIMNNLADIIIRLNEIEKKIKKLIQKTDNMCFVYSESDSESDNQNLEPLEIECYNNDFCECCSSLPEKECDEIKEYLKSI